MACFVVDFEQLREKAYLGFCQASMVELCVQQLKVINYFSKSVPS